MMCKRFSRRGFTMVELLISMVVMAALLGAVGMAVQRGSGAFKQGMVVGDLEAQARRMVDRIADEFVGSIRGTFENPLLPNANAMASSLDFRQAQGFAGGALGAVVEGPMNRIAMQIVPSELDDGVDNNGNGLIDEQEIVLIRDVGGVNQTIRWGGFVRELLQGEVLNGADDNGNGLIDEPGLMMFIDDDNDNTLTIQLTLERLDEEGRLVTRTVSTAVRIRN